MHPVQWWIKTTHPVSLTCSKSFVHHDKSTLLLVKGLYLWSPLRLNLCMKTAKALQRAKHWTHLELQNGGKMGCSVSKPRPLPGFSQLFRKGHHVCAHSLSFKQSNLWIFHHCLVNDTAGFSVTEARLWKRSVVLVIAHFKTWRNDNRAST